MSARLPTMGLAGLVLLGGISCEREPEYAGALEVEPESVGGLELLPEGRLLRRLSLDLRGTLPGVAELAAVEADPAALQTIRDTYLDDPRLEDRLVSLFAERWHTRVDVFDIEYYDYHLDPLEEFAFEQAVGEEPLRLMARIAVEDRPWVEIVTTDTTVANEVLGALWPLDYPEGETGWQQVRYTDDRPAAGVLSTSSMWLRYASTSSNLNRKRANQVSRIFLCNDYLLREIAFDRDLDLLDADAIEHAVQNNPACVNCHNSLDPLASYFFGFWTYQNQSYAEVANYHPDRERLWEDAMGVAPAFYGVPGDSLDDLGVQLASDPRFAQCAVEQAFTLLLDRDVEAQDMGALTEHREAFLQGGLTLSALYRSVVKDPRYRAGDAVEADAAGGVPLKMASPALLSSQVADLTGYHWTYADYDMMNNDIIGVRTLAGGADGYTVTRNAAAPNATIVLVQERLAEAASYYSIVTEAELEPGARKVWTEVDFDDTTGADRDAIVAQLQHLHLLIFGKRVAADSEQVQANLELWDALYEIEGSAPYAWWGVMSALLRDPDLLLY